MKANNQLALIVAYFLSRKDRDGYKSLGFSSFNEATKETGRLLGVKVNTVKNMRDEFDPYHDNSRVGWLRELRGSRMNVLKAFQETDDGTLLEIVKGILFDQEFRNSREYEDIENLFKDTGGTGSKSPVFILRGPTGKKAEMAFLDFFNTYKKPVEGILKDKRDDGGGFDFEISNPDGVWFIEVKGLASESGGVLFTNKEWKTAVEYGSKYYLALVSGLDNVAKVKLICDPAGILKAKKNIYTTVQVNWSISDKELKMLSTG